MCLILHGYSNIYVACLPLDIRISSQLSILLCPCHEPILMIFRLITVGRRAAQWVQDLVRIIHNRETDTDHSKVADLKNITTQRQDLLFRGAMGTTGSKTPCGLELPA